MFGDRVKLLREEHALTQKELATKLKMSESQIFRYETDPDMKPRADVVIRIATYFNVSTDFILGVSAERGVYLRSDLNPQEAAVLSAWRRGERLEAIKMIAGDE